MLRRFLFTVSAVGVIAVIAACSSAKPQRITTASPSGAAAQPPTPPPTPQQQNPVYQGDLTRQEHYNSGQITLDPPGPNQSANAADPSQRPKALWQTAFAACNATPPKASCGPVSIRASVRLAIMTDTTYGVEDTVNTIVGRDGQKYPGIKPTFVQRRVWAVTWLGGDCFDANGSPPPIPAGGPTPTTAPGPSPTVAAPSQASSTRACDQITFFDADSGQYLIAYQGPAAQ